jgi:hypothetical protein
MSCVGTRYGIEHGRYGYLIVQNKVRSSFALFGKGSMHSPARSAFKAGFVGSFLHRNGEERFALFVVSSGDGGSPE